MNKSWSNIAKTFSATSLLASSLLYAQTEVDLHDLVVPATETDVSQSELLELPLGLHRIEPESTTTERILIAIHDENSTGFEWARPLQILDDESTTSYFVRWNPSVCPTTSIESVNTKLTKFLESNESVNKVTIVGLGLGGVYLSQFTRSWKSLVPLDVHVVAAPLQGTLGVFEQEDCGEILPTRLTPTIRFFQWRIAVSQNEAFEKLDEDPQEVEIQGSLVISLPETIAGTPVNQSHALEIVAARVLAEHIEATEQTDAKPIETTP